jgi:hypothetical protein
MTNHVISRLCDVDTRVFEPDYVHRMREQDIAWFA